MAWSVCQKQRTAQKGGCHPFKGRRITARNHPHLQCPIVLNRTLSQTLGGDANLYVLGALSGVLRTSDDPATALIGRHNINADAARAIGTKAFVDVLVGALSSEVVRGFLWWCFAEWWRCVVIAMCAAVVVLCGCADDVVATSNHRC